MLLRTNKDATIKPQQIFRRSKETEYAIVLLTFQQQNLPLQIHFDLMTNCN